MAKICYRITKQQFQITRCHKLDINSPFHSFIWFPKSKLYFYIYSWTCSMSLFIAICIEAIKQTGIIYCPSQLHSELTQKVSWSLFHCSGLNNTVTHVERGWSSKELKLLVYYRSLMSHPFQGSFTNNHRLQTNCKKKEITLKWFVEESYLYVCSHVLWWTAYKLWQLSSNTQKVMTKG